MTEFKCERLRNALKDINVYSENSAQCSKGGRMTLFYRNDASKNNYAGEALKYGLHFRFIIGVYEKSYDIFYRDSFDNHPVMYNDKNYGWLMFDLSLELEGFEYQLEEVLRDTKGIGYYEVFGEMWYRVYRCGNPMDGEEWDSEYEMRNETIVELPEEAIEILHT